MTANRALDNAWSALAAHRDQLAGQTLRQLFAADPARLIAAVVTMGVGLVTRNVLAAILTGMAALYLGLYLIG